MRYLTKELLTPFEHGRLVGRLMRALNQTPAQETLEGRGEYYQGFRVGYADMNTHAPSIMEREAA